MTVTTISNLSEIVESKVGQNNPENGNPVFLWCKTHWVKIFSEFISTLMLVLFGCMTAVPLEEPNSSMYTPLGFGLIVMFNIQIFGHISGAYMNPAVTLATVIWGTNSVLVGIAYTIVQCLGAIAGYGILDALTSMGITEGAVCVTMPYTGQSQIQSLGIEFALTAALVFINCAVWDPVNKDRQDSAPIKFGLTIVGLSLVGGPLTGASMNPARTLGPAVWTNVWIDHWVYWVGPIISSVVTTVLYKVIFLKKPKDN